MLAVAAGTVVEIGEERSRCGAGLLCRLVVALVEKMGQLWFAEGLVCRKKKRGCV